MRSLEIGWFEIGWLALRSISQRLEERVDSKSHQKLALGVVQKVVGLKLRRCSLLRLWRRKFAIGSDRSDCIFQPQTNLVVLLLAWRRSFRVGQWRSIEWLIEWLIEGSIESLEPTGASAGQTPVEGRSSPVARSLQAWLEAL